MFTFFIDPAKRNPMTSRATDEELEDEVKTWLRGAPDRCGGRALRAQRAAKRALARHSIAQRHGITHRSPASRHGSTQRSCVAVTHRPAVAVTAFVRVLPVVHQLVTMAAPIFSFVCQCRVWCC